MLFSNLIRPGDTVALGDVHGNYDLLSQFLDHVKGSGSTVIFLGDLVDRGPDDLKVLDTVKQLLDDPFAFGLLTVHVIRGNHEQMLIDAATRRLGDYSLWVQNGGNTAQQDQLFEHVSWLSKLPLYRVLDDTLFVHAGIMPGVPMAKQRDDDLIWIRQPFLDSDLQLNKVFPDGSVKRVIHGHSPYTAPMPDIYRQRICLDTGAYFSGVLTCFNATTNRFWSFEREPADLQLA